MLQTIDGIQAQNLKLLKARLITENIPFTEGKMIDVYKVVKSIPEDDPNFQEECLIVNGWTVNFDRWGFVMDTPNRDDFFDNGDIDSLIEYIRSTVLPQPE